MKQIPTVAITVSFLFFLASCAADDDDDSGGETSAASVTASGTTMSASATTSSNDESSGSESAMTGSDESEESDESGDGPECNPADEHEPNDAEDASDELPEFADQCDVDSSLSGVLSGDADVDWLSYRGGTNDLICSNDPTVEVVASGPVRFCQYVDCIEGDPSTGQCPSGTTADTSDEGGRPGCCTDGEDVAFTMSVGCSSDAEVFMRVDQGEADVCTTYSVSYHF